MACGLGAVILLFFIIDFQEIPQIPDDIPNNNVVSSEEELLRINEMKNREKILSNEINKMSQQLAKAIEEEVKLSIVSAPMDKDKIKSQIANANNKPGSLIGLTVKGPKILVLLDTSASMAYPKLVDIILGIDEKTGRKKRRLFSTLGRSKVAMGELTGLSSASFGAGGEGKGERRLSQ